MGTIDVARRISRLARRRQGDLAELTQQLHRLSSQIEQVQVALVETEARLSGAIASRLDDAWGAAQLRHEHVVNLLVSLNADEHDMSKVMHKTVLDLARQMSRDVAVTRQHMSDVLVLLGHPTPRQEALRAAVYADASL